MTIISKIEAFLCESARLELLSKQFGVPVEEIEHLYLPADPTNGKYLTWVMRQVKAGNLRFPEDTEKVKVTLERFDKFKRARDFIEMGYPRDLNQYKTYGELARVIQSCMAVGVQTKGEQTRQQASEGTKLIKMFDSGVAVYAITTHEALVAMGAKRTEWCVKDPKYFEQYAKQGLPFYLAVDQTGDPIELLHLPSEQCMDVWDEPTSPALFEKAGIDCFDLLDSDEILDRLEQAKGDKQELGRLINKVLEAFSNDESKINLDSLLSNRGDVGLIKALQDEYGVPMARLDALVFDHIQEFIDLSNTTQSYLKGSFLSSALSIGWKYASRIRNERWEWYEQLCDQVLDSNLDTPGIIDITNYAVLFELAWPKLEQALLRMLEKEQSACLPWAVIALKYWTSCQHGEWEEATPIFQELIGYVNSPEYQDSAYNRDAFLKLASQYNEVSGRGVLEV